jgi:G3E family GTPase
VGIDGELVAESRLAAEGGVGGVTPPPPHFVELNDGCICCTVRGDLQKALHELRPKRKLERIDVLVLETTGLAEPGPVVQTFLADAKLRQA